MEYLMIDGYNVINAWHDVFDVDHEPLEDMRDKLVAILSNYQGYGNQNIIVVFDAHMVKGIKEHRENYDNILVVFTKENETADNYIERFVYRMSSTNTIRVVTSDYLEQRTVLMGGGVRITPKELKEEIDKTSRSLNCRPVTGRNQGSTLMDRVGLELLQKLEKIRRGKL